MRDGVSIRVRFRDHEQIKLIQRAAERRGIARDLFIQNICEAVACKVLKEPPAPPIEQLALEAHSDAPSIAVEAR